jgi:hypothetical protein
MSDPNQPADGDPFAPPPAGGSANIPGIPGDTPPPPPPPPAPAYGAPPAAPAYGTPQAYGAPVADVPNNMGLAIAGLIAGLCCSGIFGLITGILAVVNASSVKNKLAVGDVAGAQDAAKKARTFALVSFALAAVGIVVSIILAATGVLNTSVTTS